MHRRPTWGSASQSFLGMQTGGLAIQGLKRQPFDYWMTCSTFFFISSEFDWLIRPDVKIHESIAQYKGYGYVSQFLPFICLLSDILSRLRQLCSLERLRNHAVTVLHVALTQMHWLGLERPHAGLSFLYHPCLPSILENCLSVPSNWGVN